MSRTLQEASMTMTVKAVDAELLKNHPELSAAKLEATREELIVAMMAEKDACYETKDSATKEAKLLPENIAKRIKQRRLEQFKETIAARKKVRELLGQDIDE